jgi:hypothetical protein
MSSSLARLDRTFDQSLMPDQASFFALLDHSLFMSELSLSSAQVGDAELINSTFFGHSQ